MAKQTLTSQYGRPTYTLTEYLRKFGLQYADLDAMIISYPEAFDHCYNRLLQLVYNLIIIDNEPKSIEDTFLKFCIFVNGKATFFKTDAADGAASSQRSPGRYSGCVLYAGGHDRRKSDI